MNPTTLMLNPPAETMALACPKNILEIHQPMSVYVSFIVPKRDPFLSRLWFNRVILYSFAEDFVQMQFLLV